MPLQLTYTHKEIINLIQDINSPKELAEIKSLLTLYFTYKVTQEADKALLQNNYPDDIFESWKDDHFRKTS